MTDNLPTPQRIFINQQRGGVQPTNVADVAPVVPAKRARRCKPPPNGCGGLLAGPSGSELGCTCCSCPGCGKCTKIGTKQHLPTRCGEDRIGPCPEGKFVYQRCEGCNATQQALKRASYQQRLKELDMHSAAVAVEIPAQDEETAASAILALAPPASSLPAGHSAALSSAMWTQLQERDHVDGAASAPAPGDAAAAVSAAEAASAASAAAIFAAAATASTTTTLASVPPAHSAPEPPSTAPVSAAPAGDVAASAAAAAAAAATASNTTPAHNAALASAAFDLTQEAQMAPIGNDTQPTSQRKSLRYSAPAAQARDPSEIWSRAAEVPERTHDLGECQAKKVNVNPRDIPGSMLEFVEHCVRQKPPTPGIGEAKDFITWRSGSVNANAGELLFRPTPPYDVIAPPAAKQRIGASLRVARQLIKGDELSQLQQELHVLPRSLPWGSDEGKKHLSKRAFMHLDSDVEAQVSKEEALDGIHDKQALHAAIVAAGKASRTHKVCTPALAERVRKLMCLEPGSLRGMQANYQHDDFTLHMDDPKGDGFGRDVATANVRGDGIAVIEEISDRRPPRTPSASWWFQLSPGDVWCMPGDKEHGYVRWNCYHGLPHDEIKEECQPGCTQCRISLNLRYGHARSP